MCDHYIFQHQQTLGHIRTFKKGFHFGHGTRSVSGLRKLAIVEAGVYSTVYCIATITSQQYPFHNLLQVVISAIDSGIAL